MPELLFSHGPAAVACTLMRSFEVLVWVKEDHRVNSTFTDKEALLISFLLLRICFVKRCAQLL